MSDSDNKAIYASLIKAQGELRSVPFDSANPHYRSKYASLAGFQEAIRPIMLKYELGLIQLPGYDLELGKHFLTTTLIHSSGQSIVGRMYLELTKQDMQGLGSAITYAKRYALSALLNVSGAEDDDDATRAVEPQRHPEYKNQDSAPAYESDQIPRPPLKHAPPKNHAPGAETFDTYVVSFGKYRGKKLRDIGLHNCVSFKEWLVDAAKKENKPLGAGAQRFIEMTEKFYEDEVAKNGPPQIDVTDEIPF